MNYEEFKKQLKKCNLTIKEFANICGLTIKEFSNMTGINNTTISTTWKSKNEVPKWAVTWLDNYQKAKRFETAKKALCDEPVKKDDE